MTRDSDSVELRAMTTTDATEKTPGTLKAALIVWMLAMGGLLGYSIATADATAEEDGHAPAESSETGHETPAPSPSAGTGTATTSPSAPAASPTAAASH